jgi:hypothetical protein
MKSKQGDRLRNGLARLFALWVHVNGLTWNGAVRRLRVRHPNQVYRLLQAKRSTRGKRISADRLIAMLDRAGVRLDFTFEKKSLFLNPAAARRYRAVKPRQWKRARSTGRRVKLAQLIGRQRIPR